MRKNSSALILLSGDLTSAIYLRSLISTQTYILAADGGANYAEKLALVPDVIIGDFDSIDSDILARYSGSGQKVKILSFPTDKDQTDAELALEYLVEHGFKQVIIAGFMGTRFDHMLGNIFLLRKFHEKFDDLRIIEGNQEIYIIAGNSVVHGAKGDIISFMPIAGAVTVSESNGLVYDLSKYVISQTENPGVSNVMTRSTVTVDITSGELLVIHSLSS